MPSISTVKIDAVYSHPTDRGLDLLMLKDTPVAAQRGLHRIDDTVIHFQPGIMLPSCFTAELSITGWLQTARYPGEVVDTPCLVTVRMIGNLPSYGFVIPTEMSPGADLTDHYRGRLQKGLVKVIEGSFHSYCNIPNYYETALKLSIPEIPVRITEKIHGVHSRIGYIGGEFLCGSSLCDELKHSVYGNPLSHYMQSMLIAISEGTRDVVVFGEIYGSKVTFMDYGTYGADGYAMYDITVNGVYMDWIDVVKYADRFRVRLAPLIYSGINNPMIASHVSIGPTLLSEAYMIRSKYKGREGAVIVPTVEQTFSDGSRMILKTVSAEYLSACNSNQGR